MSGSFDYSKDGFLFIASGPNLTEREEALLNSNFDTQVDYDILDIELDLKEVKKINRIFILKTVFYIPSWIIYRLTFGKERSQEYTEIYKLQWKLYRKKITLKEFNKSLTSLLTKGIMGL